MSDKSKEIHDMIQTFSLEGHPELLVSQVLDILTAMNRRMDEIEASVLKAKHDATPILGFTEVSPSSVSVPSRTIKPS